MGRRKSAAINDLISSGLIKEGELLRYKNKQGQLLLVGRARTGGIEVQNSSGLLNFTAFEAAAGSKYHRPAEHTHSLSGASLQALQLKAASSTATESQKAELAADGDPIFEESHDEFCYICGLGGDLMCCEGCPATMHARCAGLEAVPEHDWYCPWCHCTACGAPGWDPAARILPAGVAWVECGEQYRSMGSMGGEQYRPAWVGGSQAPAPPGAAAAAAKHDQAREAAGCSAAPVSSTQSDPKEPKDTSNEMLAATSAAGAAAAAVNGAGDVQPPPAPSSQQEPAVGMEIDGVADVAPQQAQQEEASLGGGVSAGGGGLGGVQIEGSGQQVTLKQEEGEAVKLEEAATATLGCEGGGEGNGAAGQGRLDLSCLLDALREAFKAAGAASAAVPLAGGSPAAAEGQQERSGALPAAPSAHQQGAEGGLREPEPAEARCPTSGRRVHATCLPPDVARQAETAAHAAPNAPLWFNDGSAAVLSCQLAQLCARGAVPLGLLGDGTPLSFQLVRGAAVAAPEECCGYTPRYNDAQRQELRDALSAAAHILRSCYQHLVDSRTGGDAMLWMLRGACLAGKQLDFSTMHTALLYVGTTLACVGCLRLLGPRCAEVPLLATRPELQRNTLGSVLLAALEAVVGGVLSPGALLLTPAFWGPGQPYLAYPPGQEGVADEVPILQARWGYALASRQQLLEAWKFPLVRLPGVLLAGKEVGREEAAAVPTAGGGVQLPQSLSLNDRGCDLAQLIREGVAAVARGESKQGNGAVKPEPDAGEGAAGSEEGGGGDSDEEGM